MSRNYGHNYGHNYGRRHRTNEEDVDAWDQLPRGAQDGTLVGLDMSTPVFSNSPAESAATTSSYDSKHEAEQDPSFSQPQSAPPAPYVYPSGPGLPPTQPHTAGTTGTAGMMDASWADPTACLQDDRSEVLSYDTPSRYLPADPGSSGGSADRSSPHSRPNVSAQPSPAAQPPYYAPSPYQRGESSVAQYAGKRLNPRQQAGRHSKRTHDHLSPSSEEGRRGKGKQRQVSPGQGQGGQGQTSAPGAAQDVYDLTESPGPRATFIDPRQAGGGGYVTQNWGGSSAQGGAPQHPYVATGSIDPRSVLVNQSGAGAGYAQHQGESSFPGADWRRASAPKADRAPLRDVFRPPGMPRANAKWSAKDMDDLEEIMSGYETIEDAAVKLQTTLKRSVGACQNYWDAMLRHWEPWEDECLRRLEKEPDDWEAFARGFSASGPYNRNWKALQARYKLLARSNEPYNLGNRRV